MGEDAVCKYLTDRGHSIIDRNWRSGHLEIDIVSIDRSGIHFVEVKSRVAPVQAEPYENVTVLKQRRIARAAQRYISQKTLEFKEMELWLDVASVTFDGASTEIEYFPAAYVPLFLDSWQ